MAHDVSVEKVHYNCFHLHYSTTDFRLKYIHVLAYDGPTTNEVEKKWETKIDHGIKQTLDLNNLQPGKSYRLKICFLDACNDVIEEKWLPDIQTGT